jgi:hypothetical protein
MLRRCYAAALLTGGISLLPGLLRILLLLMLRILAAVLPAAGITWIIFVGTLSVLRALLIGHLKPPGIFIPSSRLGSRCGTRVAFVSRLTRHRALATCVCRLGKVGGVFPANAYNKNRGNQKTESPAAIEPGFFSCGLNRLKSMTRPQRSCFQSAGTKSLVFYYVPVTAIVSISYQILPGWAI